ncbi:MAG: hypothetical protein ABIN25_07080 [Ginsengibacter sp.]
MADQNQFTVYFLSADIKDLIDKGATDIKITASMKNGTPEFKAEGVNTNESPDGASTMRSVTAGGKDIKVPCPMPCSTFRAGQ